MDDQFPREALALWAAKHSEINTLYIFGSRARGDAKPNSGLDLAFELDDARESELTVLINNNEHWKKELRKLSGLVVKDLRLRSDPVVSGVLKEVFRRYRN